MRIMKDFKVKTLNLVNDSDEWMVVTSASCVLKGGHEELVANFATAMNQDEDFRRIVLDAFSLIAQQHAQ